MAKNGLRVMDSDLHVVEPRTLWDDYLDPRFRGRILWDNCARLYKLAAR